jgi:helix-turn-helix protein
VCARSLAERPGPRALWVGLESIHAVTYFAPGCRSALRDVGLKGSWSGYFAARAAPLGAVGAGPVTAAFANFHPDMVARAVRACWEVVAPEVLWTVRARRLKEGFQTDAARGLYLGAGFVQTSVDRLLVRPAPHEESVP